MIDAADFLEQARGRGVDFVTGVPCSFLTPLINAAASDPRAPWVVATSEGEAVAIAAGAWFAGRLPLVLMQNSGLGNAVNPLTSLNWPFRIPVLLAVSRRGAPDIKDEPQHELMGAITPDLLDLMRVPRVPFPAEAAGIGPALDAAAAGLAATRQPHAFVVGKDDLAPSGLDEPAAPPRPPGRRADLPGDGGLPPSRMTALALALDRLPSDAAVVATTGYCGRELFTLRDEPRFLYLVGAMGAASAVGLGIALCTPRPVIVFDGDGAALMKLGNLATIGARAPDTLIHIVFDNERHASTGGQRTVSPGIDFAGIAQACGYRLALSCRDQAGFAAALDAAAGARGPVLVHAKVSADPVPGLGRPTVAPSAVADRFRAFLGGSR
ncbi:phosphonopyruvate decarboxylase [Aquabacter spiritensis]|uniref:Phosphonopyruvate decarboxylase n=1 Tax=Aquabacter spiritensis TaxID=933073 RepID=A0A4R3LU70_9HYPH|nr:phosphonopyruvate decarboxylase [Aquabacter spiritensis]TCT03526.1 phosphonopyruvate decarboxylase [Aquabacter spiritensis]